MTTTPKTEYTADERLTAAEYRAALTVLGFTQARAAKVMGISVRTSNGYANGWPIPKLVALALFYLCQDPHIKTRVVPVHKLLPH